MKLTFFILNKVFGFRDYFVHCLKKNPKAQYFRTIGYQLVLYLDFIWYVRDCKNFTSHCHISERKNTMFLLILVCKLNQI